MIFALILLASSASDDTAAVQQEVDQLVTRCEASNEVKFVAHSDRQVQMQLLTGLDVTATQRQHLTCVLDGLKSIPDLSFGFIGNEATPDGS